MPEVGSDIGFAYSTHHDHEARLRKYFSMDIYNNMLMYTDVKVPC